MDYRDPELTEMYEGFVARFEEAVMGTPYEGEHVFVDGGPVDPLEVLREEFEGHFADEKIAEVAADLTARSGEWVKRQDLSG